MPKKPAIKHEYNQKKDRFDITIKHYSLEKKWLRAELVDALLGMLDKNPSRDGRRPRVKDVENTRIEEVGD